MPSVFHCAHFWAESKIAFNGNALKVEPVDESKHGLVQTSAILRPCGGIGEDGRRILPPPQERLPRAFSLEIRTVLRHKTRPSYVISIGTINIHKKKLNPAVVHDRLFTRKKYRRRAIRKPLSAYVEPLYHLPPVAANAPKPLLQAGWPHP